MTDKLIILEGNDAERVEEEARKTGNKLLRVIDLDSCWDRITNKNLFSEPTTFIVKNDTDFFKVSNMIENLESKIKCGTLILAYDKIDKRSKLYKLYKDRIKNVDHYKPKELVNILDKETDSYFEKELIGVVAKSCGYDWKQSKLELYKMCTLDKIIGRTATSEWINSGNFSNRQEEINVFSTVSRVMKHHNRRALVDVRALKDQGQSVIGIISILYSNFEAAARIYLRGDKDGKPTPSNCGLNPFVFNSIIKSGSFNYQNESIIPALRICIDIIEGIKSGRYEEKMAVELTILKLSHLE